MFEDTPPAAVYAPAGAAYEVTRAHAGRTRDLHARRAAGGGEARADRRPTRITREVRGQGTNTRYVRNILPETEAAESLLVVEVITPGGHWSSYPPHKHDTATRRARRPRSRRPTITASTRRRASPSSASTPTTARSMRPCRVEDGDVVMVPRGYHPVGAPHGYDLYYLNVMAGPEADLDLPQRSRRTPGSPRTKIRTGGSAWSGGS